MVIIGLLVGGILAGRSLIRAGELRSVTADRAQYLTAVTAFRDQFMALPGDMATAVNFWGAQAGGTAEGWDGTCRTLDHTSPATGQATCNGNGNGQIGLWQATTGNARFESLRAWQHMANAGLVSGQFSGVMDSATNMLPGWNIPASKVQGAGFNLIYIGSDPNSTFLYSRDYNHVLFFGKPGSQHGMGFYAAIRPEDAWNIDTKLDDGRPAYGRVMTAKYGNPHGDGSSANCATSATASSAEYALSDTEIRCGLIFLLGF